jgi:hypothetical protein
MENANLKKTSLFKLKMMLASGEMKYFMRACEELSAREEREAYEAMKRYINHKDKYKRLYVLKTIFRHPCAAGELIPWLEENIASGEQWFRDNGLRIIGELGLKIDREILLSAVERELKNLYSDGISALSALEASEENFRAILAILEKAAGKYQKESIAEILCEKYLPEKADELFALFSVSDFAKVRIIAARIGRKYGFDLEKMKYDENGHVRKIAEKGLGKLEFLRKYTGEYTVEFSKDLESAIIVNPCKDEYIEIDLDHGDDWEEYTVCLAGTHDHFDYAEDAEEYIDDFVSGRFCSVCYLRADGPWLMSTSIDSADIPGLTYEKICEMMWYAEPKRVKNVKIEIRGFLPENDYDITVQEKEGEVYLIKKKVL